MRRITGLHLAVFLATWLLAACLSPGDPAPDSFYLEATITVIDDRDGVAHSEVTTRLRWRSESTERWYWEVDQSGADAFTEAGMFSLSDGETVWFYDGASNTYQRTEPFALPTEFVATPFPSLVQFGPTNRSTLDELAGEMLLRDPELEVVVPGFEEYLGRDAALLDYRPTWRAASTTAPPGDPNARREESSGGVGRMWVDLDRMFILRHEIDGGSNRQYVVVKVTLVDFGPTFEEGQFEFVAPVGATEGAPSSDGTSRGIASS